MDLFAIKPLRWTEWSNSNGSWAEAPDEVFGRFLVSHDGEGGWFDVACDYFLTKEPCESVEDGKAKAEAWRLERLLHALVKVEPAGPSPQQRAEAGHVRQIHHAGVGSPIPRHRFDGVNGGRCAVCCREQVDMIHTR